ncbi:MAG: cell division protein SepF [Butyrivibrio sp.]|nr:cell division protein SepF [Butyrivibrio sp.]
MGFIDGFLDKMKLGSNYDDDDEYDEYDDGDDEVSAVRTVGRAKSVGTTVRRAEPEDDYTSESKEETPPKSVKPARQSGRGTAKTSGGRVVAMQGKNNGMEVCVIKPNNIEDGSEIAETLLSGRAVVLNLEGLNVDIAQRIIDFTSGACYSMQGNLQRISNYIFIVTPRSIDISGDFQELFSGGEFSLGPDFKL